MKLQWGPFIEISFVITNNELNIKNIFNNLISLKEYWIFLNINNIDSLLNKNFEWVILNDKKFFDLYINIISEELILFEFVFIYYTWINWECYGVNDNYINSELINLLNIFFKIFNSKLWIIWKEESITTFFKTTECYPHEDYNLHNIDYEKISNTELCYVLK
jgi:hypothetical protein